MRATRTPPDRPEAKLASLRLPALLEAHSGCAAAAARRARRLCFHQLPPGRGHSRRVMDLHAYPQVLPFVESIRATLAGDRSALEKLFHLEFSGNVARWTLTLVPLESKVKNSVSQVRIDGMRDQLLKVEIRQPDGDRSLMTLRPAPP